MPRVHPNAAMAVQEAEAAPAPSPAVLTVWRKSLLFNCDGFTVFDARGDLAFRVDCYGPGRRGRRGHAEVVLMDVAGRPLLTVRRRRLLTSLAEHWVIYDGDGCGGGEEARPLLSVRRHVGLRASKAVAHVTPAAGEGEEAYVVEGSYGRRSLAVRDAAGEAVAEVRRKEAVGDDVFRLVAEPRLGAPLAMALVIALDEMFRRSASPAAAARSLLPRSWSG